MSCGLAIARRSQFGIVHPCGHNSRNTTEKRGRAKAAPPRLLLLFFYPNDYGIL